MILSHRTHRHTETNKASTSLTKVLRNAASAERNKHLQSFLFLQAQKYETLDGDRESLTLCSECCESVIDDAKKMLVGPLRVRARDVYPPLWHPSLTLFPSVVMVDNMTCS